MVRRTRETGVAGAAGVLPEDGRQGVQQPPSPRAEGSKEVADPTLGVVAFWARMSEGALFQEQRRASAQVLRDLWSAVARASNRLRNSKFEAYRHEFGMVVSRNRSGAPKALPGPAAKTRMPYGYHK